MNGEKQAKVPALIKPIRIPSFQFTEMAPLFDNLPAAKKDRNIVPWRNITRDSEVFSTAPHCPR